MFKNICQKNDSFHGFWSRNEAVRDPYSEARYAEMVKKAYMVGAINDPYVQKELFRLKGNPESDFNYYRVIKSLEIYEIKSLCNNSLFSVPPESAVSQGDILLANTFSVPSIPVRITKEQGPITFLSGTRTGKTVYAQNLILNNADVFDASWIFDFYGKDNWRGMISPLKEKGKTLCVCPWQEDKTNLVHSSGLTSFSASASDLTDCLAVSFDVKTHSLHYVRSALRRLNPSLQDNSHQYLPCLADVLAEISKSDYKFNDSLLEKMEDICEVFPQYTLGWNTEDLVRLSILWELTDLDREIQIFSLGRKVLAAFRSAIHSKLEKGLLMVVDEGNRVFITGSKLAETVSVVLAAKILLLICFQSLSAEGGQGLSQYVLDNATTKILGRAGLSSMEKYASGMGLNQEQKEFAKKCLRPGLFVMLHPNYGEPFLITVPNLVLPCVTEKEIEESKAPLRRLPAIPAETKSTKNTIHLVAQGDRSNGLSDDEITFLKEICENPWLSASQHYERLPFSTRHAVEIKDKLINQCFIQPYEDSIGLIRKGRPRLYLEPVPPAFKILGLEKVDWGRGGYAHVLYVHTIGNWLERQGYKVEYEKKYGDKFVDLVGINNVDGTSLAVEVELSLKHWKENLIGCLAIGFSDIWIVGLDNVLSVIEAHIQTMVNSDRLAKIRLKKISEFF